MRTSQVQSRFLPNFPRFVKRVKSLPKGGEVVLAKSTVPAKNTVQVQNAISTKNVVRTKNMAPSSTTKQWGFPDCGSVETFCTPLINF